MSALCRLKTVFSRVVSATEVSHKLPKNSILQLQGPSINPCCGMKANAWVKRRCEFCYLTYEKGCLTNRCSVFGRHHHFQKPKKHLNKVRLVYACSGYVKPWK